MKLCLYFQQRCLFKPYLKTVILTTWVAPYLLSQLDPIWKWIISLSYPPKMIKNVTYLDFTYVSGLDYMQAIVMKNWEPKVTALHSYCMIISICTNVLIISILLVIFLLVDHFHLWILHLVHINHLPNEEIALHKPLISDIRLGWRLIWNLTIDT